MQNGISYSVVTPSNFRITCHYFRELKNGIIDSAHKCPFVEYVSLTLVKIFYLLQNLYCCYSYLSFLMSLYLSFSILILIKKWNEKGEEQSFEIVYIICKLLFPLFLHISFIVLLFNFWCISHYNEFIRWLLHKKPLFVLFYYLIPFDFVLVHTCPIINNESVTTCLSLGTLFYDRYVSGFLCFNLIAEYENLNKLC